MKSESTLRELVRRIDKLERAVFGPAGRKGKDKRGVTAGDVGSRLKVMDFSMSMRAFVKKHAAGMSGRKKFTLLLAHLTKGDSSKRVSLIELKKQWNRMTAKGLLAMKFNPFYTAQARESDWVATEKNGSYYLRPRWKEIFQ